MVKNVIFTREYDELYVKNDTGNRMLPYYVNVYPAHYPIDYVEYEETKNN